jgi:L-iditol 2-dehydrogenase
MLGLFKTAKGPGNMELREVPVPEPKPDEVLLEIKAAGICGTDVHIKHDQFPYWPPVIMGHEFSGEIVEVGNDVENFKLGDRVVAEPHTKACGKCELCRTGNIQICAQKRSPGWGIDGAFARYLTMPEHLLHKIPASLSYEDAALVEPAANVVQDVLERGKVIANDTVVVIGPGPIGLIALMAAKAAGAGKLMIVGIKKDETIRLPIAREIGVDAVILADEQDAVAEVLKLTDGRGADLVVEASGDASAIASSVGMVRRLGRIAQVGLTGKDQINFPWDTAAWKVCTIIFNLSTAYTCWDRTIGLIAEKKIDARKIITHKLPLKEWKKAFELVETMQGIKVLLIPE